jgi:hypothetical protein
LIISAAVLSTVRRIVHTTDAFPLQKVMTHESKKHRKTPIRLRKGNASGFTLFVS